MPTGEIRSIPKDQVKDDNYFSLQVNTVLQVLANTIRKEGKKSERVKNLKEVVKLLLLQIIRL